MAELKYPPWWPAGCDEQLARECNCDRCELMIEKLEEHRDGIAVDGEHATLDSFARP